jgi:hypothetical protein
MHALSLAWTAVRRFYGVLEIVRFSILIPAVLILTLLAADQMGDALIAVAESRTWTLLLTIMTVFAALVVWYTARTMLRFRFSDNPASDPLTHPVLKRELPRLLAISVPVSLLGKVWVLRSDVLDSWTMTSLAIVMCGATLITAAYVYLRRRLAKVPGLSILAEQEAQERRNLSQLSQLMPVTKAIFWLLELFSVIALYLAIYGQLDWVGAPALLMLSLGIIGTNGSALVYIANHHRIPVLTLLALWAVVCSPFNDNHAVRQTSESHSHGFLSRTAPIPIKELSGSSPLGTQTLKQYFDGWWDELTRLDQESGPVPVVVVAADGGGIRAAYWAAAVLAELQDRSPHGPVPFSRHVFAISGVSGGSLGAATFAAIAADRAESQLPTITTWEQEADDMLGRDYLSPTFANALFPDLIQRFIPVPVFDDRAISLEKSWERAWAEAHPSDPNRFAAPFNALWARNPHQVPLLFLNGTMVESGQRSIMEPLANVGDEDANFSGAVRLSVVLGPQVPLSTAVLTSARFTYVSPVGVLAMPSGATSRARVADGGYFDNSGGITARQIIQAISDEYNARNSPREMKIVVLHIRNAPPDDESSRAGLGTLPNGRVWLGEILSPVLALLDVRGAHGEQSVDDLIVRSSTREFHDVKLYRTGTAIPLGWALSCEAQTEMEQQLVDCPKKPGGKEDQPDCGVHAINDTLTSLYGPSAPAHAAQRHKSPICSGSHD